MFRIVQGFKEGLLSVFSFNTTHRRSLLTGPVTNYGVETQKPAVSKTVVPTPIAAFFAKTITSTSTEHMEVQMLTTELNLSGESDSHPEQSKTASQAASLTGSDSEEESGYMSCASSEQKAGCTRDTENLFTDIRNHSDSSKSDGSLNDLSSCDQNDSHDQDQDETEECQTVLYSVHPDLKSSNVMSLETQQGTEQDEQDEDIEEDLNEEESSDEEETDEEAEEEDDDNDDDEQVKTLNKEEQEESADEDEEEEDEDEDEEESIKKPIHSRSYTRQTTVVKRQDTDDNTSDGDDDNDFVLFPNSQNTKTAPQRLASSESEGTWVSEDDDKKMAVGDDNASDGPDIGDFFDGIADDVTYTFLEGEEDKVYSYSSKDFLYDRSSPVYGPINNDDDDDDDFAYLYSSDLSTGKRYAFPRREPRTISDAVDFWETDFEVKGAIYPCMASWESKGLAPTYEEDPEDFDKFNMYKSLYEKWVKCNKSSEQWSQRYWGRSIQHVARMKGPGKRPMVTSQSDSAIYVTGTYPPSSVLVVNQSVADRRRRRRNDAVSAARGTSMCY